LNQNHEPLKLLISPTTRFSFGDSQYSITEVETLPDARQGRYNIIASVCAVDPTGTKNEFFCKRYLSPESAYVEDAAYRVMDILGMSECHATLHAAEEPLLLVSRALGNLWASSDLDETTAEIIGVHCAVAYLIGNADLRPRNTFVHRNNGVVTVSVIDLEHCFFDRALDLRDCRDPFSPLFVDGLGDSVVERTKHRVLSPLATRRARRCFLPVEDMTDHRVQRFRKGWLKVYDEARQKIGSIEKFLMDRVYRTPPLIIGTQSYRRAMARLDVRDILHRMNEDGATAFEDHY
jgi:hypothetical protein